MAAKASFRAHVRVFDTADELSEAARRCITDIVLATRASSMSSASLALSGGSTPRKLYESLRAHNRDLVCDRRAVTFVMGDERLVPCDDALSNYRMAFDALLRDVPSECVLAPDPTPAVDSAPDVAAGEPKARVVAAAYEEVLLRHLPTRTITTRAGVEVRIPIVDIVLLGFGADGHTASIFPRSVAAQDSEHSVSVSYPSETMHPKVWRVTLTPHVIQHAKHVIVLAAGKDKNWVVRGILDDDVAGETPVSRFLRDCQHEVTFLLDKDAAQGVTQTM